MNPVRIKEEEEEVSTPRKGENTIHSGKQRANFGGSPRVVELLPNQAEGTNFPPGCLVWWKGISGGNAAVVGLVKSASMDFALMKLLYKVEWSVRGRITSRILPEEELSFAPGCPIYIQNPFSLKNLKTDDGVGTEGKEGWIPATVSAENREEGHSYSVSVRSMDVPKKLIKFRPVDILVVSDEFKGTLKSESISNQRPVVDRCGIAVTEENEAKRQRISESATCDRTNETILLPQWLDPQKARGYFMGRSGEKIRAKEKFTGCTIRVQPRIACNIRKEPLSIVASGTVENVKKALRLIEDCLLEFVDRESSKRLLYDLARMSQADRGLRESRRNGSAVFQRPNFHSPEKAWISIIELPLENSRRSVCRSSLIGKGGDNIRRLVSTTGCEISIYDSHGMMCAPYVFISGDSERNVNGLVGQIEDLFEGCMTPAGGQC